MSLRFSWIGDRNRRLRAPITGGIDFTKPERPLYNRASLTTSPGPIAQPG
jgi:hypothetical protein